MKISGVYKITNTITGDCYIGSSKDVRNRWAHHKIPSTWNNNPNKQLYQDMKKYGLNKFEFQVIAEVEIGSLKEAEQKFIETLKPTYNNIRAKGCDAKKFKECQKKYRQSEKGKECQKKYRQSEKGKESQKRHRQSDKHKKYEKEYQKTDKYKEYHNKYNNQLCLYNGETLTLCALIKRFRRAGFDHPTQEAKKYLLNK